MSTLFSPTRSPPPPCPLPGVASSWRCCPDGRPPSGCGCSASSGRATSPSCCPTPFCSCTRRWSTPATRVGAAVAQVTQRAFRRGPPRLILGAAAWGACARGGQRRRLPCRPPAPADLLAAVRQGELCTWAKLSAIHCNCGIEATLDACIQQVGGAGLGRTRAALFARPPPGVAERRRPPSPGPPPHIAACASWAVGPCASPPAHPPTHTNATRRGVPCCSPRRQAVRTHTHTHTRAPPPAGVHLGAAGAAQGGGGANAPEEPHPQLDAPARGGRARQRWRARRQPQPGLAGRVRAPGACCPRAILRAHALLRSLGFHYVTTPAALPFPPLKKKHRS